MKLLLAEDEKALSEALKDILIYHNYLVDIAETGNDALDFALLEDYDGIILDIMLPGIDGIEVLTTLRKKNINTPVLLLTAKSSVTDKISGLDSGADDYLTKPFDTGELLARIRAILRRRETYEPNTIQFADLTLNPQNNILSSGKNEVTLSKLEYKLMELFMKNPGVYFSSDKILEKVWGYETDAEIGSVWVYVLYLRKKLAKISSDTAIMSKRSLGYALEESKC